MSLQGKAELNPRSTPSVASIAYRGVEVTDLDQGQSEVGINWSSETLVRVDAERYD